MENNPILIIGANNIAKAIGISLPSLKRYFLGSPDFPAQKMRELNAWVSTRDKLIVWANRISSDTHQSPPH